jgi:hypothetical protein
VKFIFPTFSYSSEKLSKIIKNRAEYFRNMTIIFIAPHDQRTHRCSTDSRLVQVFNRRILFPLLSFHILTSALVNIDANASLLDKLYNQRRVRIENELLLIENLFLVGVYRSQFGNNNAEADSKFDGVNSFMTCSESC